MFVFLGIPYIPALIWECLSFWVYRVSVTNIGVYPKRQRLNYWYTNKNYTQKDKITYLVLGRRTRPTAHHPKTPKPQNPKTPQNSPEIRVYCRIMSVKLCLAIQVSYKVYLLTINKLISQ